MNKEVFEFIDEIKKTFPQSKYFVPFLSKKISGNYRGSHSLQQDRNTREQLIIAIKKFFCLANEDWMQVAPTPGDKDIYPTHKEFDNVQKYIKYVNELKLDSDFISPSGKKANPTQLSVKKILFMNMWALNLLERKTENIKGETEIIDYFERDNSKIYPSKTYYRLTDDALKIIQLNEVEQLKEISKMVKERLINDDVNLLYKLIIDGDFHHFKIKKINLIEYALTFNYYDPSIDDYEEVIQAFLELNANRKIWIPQLDKMLYELKKSTSHYKKISKGSGYIDWGNWRNQIMTKFTFLDMIPIFKYNNKEKSLLIELFGEEYGKFTKVRSQKEKDNYFKYHNIKKDDPSVTHYQLHHIVPIEYANDIYELEAIDSWKNMILISPNKHAEFPNRRNTLIKISEKSNEIEMKIVDINLNEERVIKNNDNGKYSKLLLNNIKEYNDLLIK